MTGTGPLSFDAIINDVNWRSTLDAMERRVMGLTSTTVRETSKVDQQFQRLGQLAAGYFSFRALQDLPAQILKVRGEFQQLEIAFTTMLRSKAKGDALLNSLVQTAATTPFGLKDIAAGTKQLLAYGSSAETVVKEVRMLGEVASGVSVPIGELIYLYGTLRSQGRAYAVDIRQFAGRGIPIYAELAKVLGVNVDKVNEFVESGKVGFKEVEQAFKNMTSEGGLFAGLMDAQSKSLLGLKERLSDAWDIMLNEIGKKNQDVAAALLTTATDVVANYQAVIDILKVAALTFGTYKAALVLVSVAQRAQVTLLQMVALEQSLAAASGEVLTTQQARQIVVSKLLQQAQASLNATMLANPFVLVATAIAALTTAYFVFREEAIEIKSSQELLAETGKTVSTSFKTQGAEIKTLVGLIKNQNVAESERLKAYDRLKAAAPEILRGLDFEKAKVADLTKELNLYLVSLEKKIRLEAANASLKSAVEQDIEATERLKKAQDELVKKTQNLKDAQQPRVITSNYSPTGGLTELNDVNLAQRNLNKAVEAKTKSSQALKEIEQSISSIYQAGSKDGINAEIKRLETVQSTLKDKLSPAYKQVEDQLKELIKQRDALTAAEGKGQKVVLKTVDYYDQQIKALKEQQGANSSSRAEYERYQKQIDALTKQRNRLTGEMTAAEKKAQKDADKVGPYGSVSYWENISKKAQEILEKTPTTNTSTIAQQRAIMLDADRKAEEARRQITIRSFEEELTDKREKYALYQKWVDTYSKSAADEQFNDLLKSGDSYVDYLNTQIARLEAKRNEGKLTEKDSQNLGLLLSERDENTGRKTAIEVFREGLVKARDEAQNLTDYLEVLRKKQEELNPEDTSQVTIAKRLELAEQITNAERERRFELQQFLSDYSGSEAQRLAISKRYADLRAELDKKYQNDRGEAYRTGLEQISRAEKEEIKAVNERATQASDAFKKLDQVILERGRAALKKRLEQLNAYLKEEADAVNTEAYKQRLKERDDTELALDQNTIGYVKEFAAIAGQLGDALDEVNGTLGGTGRLLSGIASQVSLVTVAFDEGTDPVERVAAGVQGLVGLVNILTSSAAERKKAEEEYYRSVIAQQLAYNLALNDQIGLQSELNENVFVKNFEGRLRDGISKLNAANKGYQAALDKLANGQAKLGQRNAVDFNNIGKGAGSGAALGAAIGSIVPGIGTAIGAGVGAVVGGLVGLFGGKKKQDEFGSLLAEYPELVRKTADGVEELNVELAQTLIAQNLVDENTKLLLQDTINWTEQIKEAKEQIRGIISELAGQLGNSLRDNLVGAFKDGTDAAQAFGDSVSEVLEDVLSQLLFNRVFSEQFDQLQKEMEESFGPGGDGSWIDDFGRFFGQADELTQLFNDGLKQAQDAAAQYGLSIFKPNETASTDKSPNSLTGAIKGVTEETASVIAGQMNAIRIQQAETGSVIKQQLLVLSGIERNTGISNGWLESIDRRIEKLNNDTLRSKGLGGN